jgi:transcription elongation factor Elf1
MGIIDQLTFTFTCPKCNAREQSSATEYGSQYGGSWSGPSEVSLFSVQWEKRFNDQPHPDGSAVCLKCRVPAKVEY